MRTIRIAAAFFDDVTNIALGFIWRGVFLAALLALPLWLVLK